MKTNWNTDLLRLAMKRKFAPKEYALLEEVRNCTGFARSERYADALVMSLYPSRGLVLTGFEIKQSRSDWVAEMKAPDKAEAIARYCDRWALVVTTPDLLHPGELPDTWGLLAPARPEWTEDGGLRWVKEPKALQPRPVDRAFLASLFRSIHEREESALNRALRDRLELARREAQSVIRDDFERRLKRSNDELDRLREMVARFQKETGICVGHHDALAISGFMSQLKQRGAQRSLGDLQHEFDRLARQAEVLARSARNVLHGLNDEPGAEWVI